MSDEILILGATGMAGQALMSEARRRGIPVQGAARSGTDHLCDLTDPDAVSDLMSRLRPHTVINAAALINITTCQNDPGLAYRINSRLVALLARACQVQNCRLVHISTDHFFTGDGAAKHNEDASVTLVNEYARTKYAGERFALALRGALALRTNITGFRGWQGRPTFAEWLFEVVDKDQEVELFEDFYTSTLDTASFARAVLTLVDKGAMGLINLAAREVASKEAFAEVLAAQLGRPLSRRRTDSFRALTPIRAESLGLDVTLAESILGYQLPDLGQVISSLVEEYRRRGAPSR